MNLVAAMRGQYSRGEALLWRGIYAKVVIYAATLVNAIWSNEVAAAIFLVLACIGQGLVLVLRSASHAHVELAERLRRLAMLQDGVGREVPALEAAILAEKIWKTAERPVNAPYYTSTLQKGPKRLIDITAECAFFSGSIANSAWRTFFGVSVLTSAVLLLSLILVTVVGTAQTRLEAIAKGVLVGITFWMTEDFLEMALRYRRLGLSCERVLQECSRLLEQQNPCGEDAYFVLQEYDSAFANTPPLPASIYARRSQRLAEIWRETHPRTTAAHAPSRASAQA